MGQAVTLDQSDQGMQGVISYIDGDQSLQKKLMSLGLRKGQQFSVLHQRSNGVVILSNGNRVAVGSSIAAHVFVKMNPASPSQN